MSGNRLSMINMIQINIILKFSKSLLNAKKQSSTIYSKRWGEDFKSGISNHAKLFKSLKKLQSYAFQKVYHKMIYFESSHRGNSPGRRGKMSRRKQN